MGAFNIGEVFGTLTAETRDFKRAIEETGGAARLLGLNLEGTTKNAASFLNAINKAGYDVERVTQWMDRMSQQGFNAARSMDIFAQSLDKVQQRVRSLQSAQAALAPNQAAAKSNAAALQGTLFGLSDALTRQTRGVALGDDLLREYQEFQSKVHTVTTNAGRRQTILMGQRLQEEIGQKVQAEKDAAARIAREQQISLENERRLQQRRVDMYRQAARAAREAEHEEHRRYFEYRSAMALSSAGMRLGLGATIAGGIGLAGMVGAGTAYAGVHEQMAQSTAIMGNLPEQTRDEMEKQARLVAQDLPKGVEKLAASYYSLASAGLNASQSMQALPIVARFSMAANADLTQSTDLLTKAMRSLGLGVEDLTRISDVLVKADTIAIGKSIEFAEALQGKGGQALKVAHKDLEEGVAVLAAYANVGIVGRAAQEALNQSLRDLQTTALKHGDVLLNVAGKQVKWKDVVYDSRGEMRHMADILGTLEKSLDGASAQTTRATFQALGFQDRTVKTTASLLGMSDTIRTYDKELRNAGGTTQDVAERQLNTFNKQAALLQANLKDITLTFGKSLVEAMNAALVAGQPVLLLLSQLAEGYANLPKPVQQTVVAGAVGGTTGLLALGGAATLGAQALGGAASMKYMMGDAEWKAMVGASPFLSGIFGEGGAGMSGLLSGFGIALGGVTSALVGAGLGFMQLQTDLKNTGIASTELSKALFEVGDVVRTNAPTSLTPYELSRTTAFAKPANQLAMEQLRTMGEIGFTGMFNEGSTIRQYMVERERMTGFAQAVKLAQTTAWARPTPGKMVVDLSKYFGKEAGEGEGAQGAAGKAEDLFGPLKLTDWKKLRDAAAEALAGGWRQFSDSQFEQAQRYLTYLNEIVDQGYDPEQVKAAMEGWAAAEKRYDDNAKEWTKLWEDEAQSIDQLAKSKSHTSRMFLDAYRKISQAPIEQVAIEGASRPQGIPTASWGKWGMDPQLSRLPEGIQRVFAQTHDLYGRMAQTGYTPQAELNRLAEVAQKNFDEISKNGQATAYDINAAWVAKVEAMARAQHVSAESISKDYRKIKESVQDTVGAADKAWTRHLREMRYQMGQLTGQLAVGVLDMFLPDGQRTDRLGGLTGQLRGAFESMTKAGYSDPAQALKGIITSIQQAGSTAEANAIAIRHFGDSGVTLAKDLRDGSLSAGDLAEAMQRATQSTIDYANQTEKRVDKLQQLWVGMAKNVARALAQDLGRSLEDHLRLTDKLFGALGKIFGGGKGAQAAGAIDDVWWAATGGIEAATSGVKTADTLANNVSGVNSAAGTTAGSAAGGAAGWANFAATAISGAINAVIGIKQEATMNAVEHNTRYAMLYLKNLMDDVLYPYVPQLESIRDYLWGAQLPMLAEINTRGYEIAGMLAGGKGGSGVVIQGDVIVQGVQDVDGFVDELKRRKIL